MIQTIYLHKLRHSEFIQFMNQLLGLTADNDVEALKVKKPYDALASIMVEANGLFKKDPSNLLTEELLNLDTDRDNAFNGIRFTVEGALHHPVKELQAHARLLDMNIKQYGTGIANLNYFSETTVLKNLLNDWRTKPELTQAISALNLTEWQKQLEKVNTEFDQKYMERNQHSGAVPQKTFREIRSEAIASYYKLRDYIDSHSILNDGADPWGKLTSEINALIDRANLLLSRHSKGSDTPPAPDASQATGVN
jgi:hypothetical protein